MPEPAAATVPYDTLVTVLYNEVGKHAAAEILAAPEIQAALNTPLGAAAPAAPALAWESAGTDEPGDQHADSVLRRHPDATSAYYSLGPALAAPSTDGERWDVELIQISHGERVGSTDLGRHPDEQTAKEAAQRWEADGLVELTWRTTREYSTRIPLVEVWRAALEETSDPDEHVTADGRFIATSLVGLAGGFSGLLGRHENAATEQRIVECRWSIEGDDDHGVII